MLPNEFKCKFVNHSVIYLTVHIVRIYSFGDANNDRRVTRAKCIDRPQDERGTMGHGNTQVTE
jgi:hypothetical protein